MWNALVKKSIDDFPLSFRLLQQEAILTKLCILTGFEFLLKGRLNDEFKGHYYASFFQLSIGIERLMKLLVISDHMVKNSYKPFSQSDLRALGHKLSSIYKKCKSLSSDYPLPDKPFVEEGSRDYSILEFLEAFANSTGRYYNISNIEGGTVVDPLKSWGEDFSERVHGDIERMTFAVIDPGLQLDDIAFNTGYVNDVFDLVRTEQANYYALWHIMNIITPLIETLNGISWKCHEIDTSTSGGHDHPAIPYYGEMFPFVFLKKNTILKRKRWTNFTS